MSQSFSNNINCLNTTVYFTVASDRPSILWWLSPPDPKLRHQDIQARRVENVGEWLLQTEGFISWYEGSGRVPIIQFCFALEIQASVRLISGSKDEPQGWKKKGKC